MQLESDLLEPLTSESSFLSPAAQVYSAFYDAPARKLPLLKTMHFVFCLTVLYFVLMFTHFFMAYHSKAAHNFCFGFCILLYFFCMKFAPLFSKFTCT